MTEKEIILRDFGDENIDWITYDDIELLDSKKIIQNLLKFVHFNNNHPENNNLRLNEDLLKQDLIEIIENNKWVQKDINIYMPKIEQNIRKIIKMKYIKEDKEYTIKNQLRSYLGLDIL